MYLKRSGIAAAQKSARRHQAIVRCGATAPLVEALFRTFPTNSANVGYLLQDTAYRLRSRAALDAPHQAALFSRHARLHRRDVL